MKQENLSTIAMELLMDQAPCGFNDAFKLSMVIAIGLDVSPRHRAGLIRSYANTRFGCDKCKNINCDKLAENMKRLKETCDASHRAISMKA